MSTDTNKLINWDNRYSVGVGKMDSEHQRLIGLINDLHAARQAGKTDAVGKVLDSLMTYTVSHFSAEEALLKKYNYPGYETQRSEHDKFTSRVKQMQADHRAGKPMDTQVMVALQQWLIQHIVGLDKKYTSHLNTAGIK